LSYWLRDFLYIPLGGSKKGKLRTYFNLFITMLLGGLWHGASWTFVFWGAYHGFFLAVERLLGDRNPLKRAPVFIQIMITNFIVMIGWAFFRSSSFPAAANVIKGLFTFSGGQHASGFMLSPAFFITTVIAVFALIKFENVFNKKWKFTPGVVIALLILFLASMSLALSQDYSPFLYFQF
ncbi:MAG: MBOAT family O-acyltransferase, partial [bacterium]